MWLGESTNLECMKHFVSAVVGAFRDEWLRPPTPEDLLKNEKRYSPLGFRGCIGAVDVHRGSGPTARFRGKAITKEKERSPPVE